MESDKLLHSITGSILSWFLVGIAWLAAHANMLAAGFAVLASIWTIRAADETIKLRKRQQQQIKNKEPVSNSYE